MATPADARLRETIRAAEADLIARFPWLGNRDVCATTIAVLAAAGMTASTIAYGLGHLPALVVIALNAFLAAVLHEIEHDLIHDLYYRSSRRLHVVMMTLVWIYRGNLVHGWYRRRLHLHHHRRSGSGDDLEERLIGLGMPWGVRRVLVTLDGGLSYVLNAPRLSEEVPGFRRRELLWASAPVYPIYLAVLVCFPVLSLALPDSLTLGWVRAVFVGWALPNLVRQVALTFVSSNIHYYGEGLDASRQVQVWRRWYLWPLQILCFNFGATHAIHHFVVDQPFYVRQAIASRVAPAMHAAGVALNDLGTFGQSNRRPL